MRSFSTMDMIESLGSQKKSADTDIADFIHIYYANYISDGDPASKLSLKEIQEIYTQCQSLVRDFKTFSQITLKETPPHSQASDEELKKEFQKQLPPNLIPLWDSLFPVRYQMRMLGDIGSTLLFVSDIINRALDDNEGGRFLGVDLGTGTGILLAAQDILARKYGYSKRQLYGIEQNQHVASKTRFFSQKLGYKIHLGDTTKSEIWNKIPKGHIDFVSNENIPAAHECMDNEPFLDNMECLYEMRSDDISPKTQFCPEKLEIIKDPKTCEQIVRYISSPENEFCTEEIADDALKMEQAGLGDLFAFLIPDKITLEGKDIPLRLVSKVGAERLGNFGYKRSFMSRF